MDMARVKWDVVFRSNEKDGLGISNLLEKKVISNWWWRYCVKKDLL